MDHLPLGFFGQCATICPPMDHTRRELQNYKGTRRCLVTLVLGSSALVVEQEGMFDGRAQASFLSFLVPFTCHLLFLFQFEDPLDWFSGIRTGCISTGT
jgi:hypothetical protein